MIKAADVKELRDITNVGMMECKKALTAANGDKEAAIKILKEKGLAISAKRSGKETNEGVVFVKTEDKKAWMVKICCETDFVAKNELFSSFVDEVGVRFVKEGAAMLEAEDFTNYLTDTVAKTGEKINIEDPVVIETDGFVQSYLHANKKVGVLVELGGDAGVLANEKVQELGKDLCLQITAMDPVAISMDDVAAEVKEEQKQIFLKQMEEDKKPEEIKEKIISGKINKYFSEKCLLEMEYVKESGTVKEHVAKVAKEVGGDITVKSFTRHQIGN